MKAASPSNLRLALVLGAISAIAPVSIDMYLPALPALGTEFGASKAEVQQSLSAYLLGMACGQLVHGPLSDRYGRKMPLVIALGLYTAAALGCALATGAHALILMRIMQGLAGSVGAVASRAIARDCHEGPALVRILAMVLLVSGVAPMLAPLLGGWTLLLGSWRLIFLAQVLFGLALMASVAWGLPETHPVANRSLGGIAGSLRDLLGVLRTRAFLAYALPFALSAGALFAYIVASPFVFVQHFGVSEHNFGWFFGINALGLILGAQVSSRLVRRWSVRAVTIGVLTAQAATALIFVGVALGAGGLWATAVSLLAATSAVGFVFPVASAGGMMPFAKQAGSASAMMGVLHGLMGALASSLVGHVPGAGAVPMAIVMASCEVLALVIFLALLGTRRRAAAN